MGRDVEKVSPTRDPLATAVLMLFVGLIMVIVGSGAIQIVVVFAGSVFFLMSFSFFSSCVAFLVGTGASREQCGEQCHGSSAE